MRFRKTWGPLSAVVGKFGGVYRLWLFIQLALGSHSGLLFVLWYLVPLSPDESEPPAEVFDFEVRTCMRTGVLLMLLLKEHAFKVEQIEGLLRLLSLELPCAGLLPV